MAAGWADGRAGMQAGGRTIADRRRTIGDRTTDRSATAPGDFFNRSGSRGVNQEESGGLGE